MAEVGRVPDQGVKEIEKLEERSLSLDLNSRLYTMSGPEGAVEHIPRLKRNEIRQLTEDEELSMGIC